MGKHAEIIFYADFLKTNLQYFNLSFKRFKNIMLALKNKNQKQNVPRISLRDTRETDFPLPEAN